jgi:hypothetical protein
VRQLLNKYLTKSKTDKDKAATYTLKMSVVTLIRLSLNSYKFIHHAQPCLA